MSMKLGVDQQFQPSVYVYEAPVRLWHWINASAVVVLALTGYFIGSPLPTMPGEASAHFLMGYIRFAHFAAGYVLIAGFLMRAYWALAGNEHARQIFMPPVRDPKWWADVVHEAAWYMFIAREPKKYVGHNPLATLSMHVLFVWGSVFMMVTGLALYGEGEGMTSWQYHWFSSWVIPLFGNSQWVHTYHHLGMWVIVCFVMVHIYAAVREDIMSRQSIVSTMISGWRTFKDTRPPDDGTH
ncbi:Ni/Fe-hydrogenase, b-type cytochrome subunit [Hyphomicrobium denitrificans 1NES1]|uniref:Probable Ni/Fe-hydrogenase B-type cytochrome subunit n=1 Tax=Hyphomicrobium denitrificans 1NES1 TaxID=670307 RepID=N0B2W0_9HYPH|nr:Ni/Fe-hydrogenase, b-type cytochrome subunit [Hyphomicrobium denitrificans]AGK57338.1 Ni/Fe-hydrogenase, b-type cytochrome subunit [Hyphomicrobium denitrificans 1NES1]